MVYGHITTRGLTIPGCADSHTRDEHRKDVLQQQTHDEVTIPYKMVYISYLSIVGRENRNVTDFFTIERDLEVQRVDVEDRFWTETCTCSLIPIGFNDPRSTLGSETPVTGPYPGGRPTASRLSGRIGNDPSLRGDPVDTYMWAAKPSRGISIIPQPRVSLVDGSIRINAPVFRLDR